MTLTIIVSITQYYYCIFFWGMVFHSIGDGSVLFGTVSFRGKAGLEIVEPQRKLFQFRRLEPETGIQKSLPICQEISSAILEICDHRIG